MGNIPMEDVGMHLSKIQRKAFSNENNTFHLFETLGVFDIQTHNVFGRNFTSRPEIIDRK